MFWNWVIGVGVAFVAVSALTFSAAVFAASRQRAKAHRALYRKLYMGGDGNGGN